MAEIGIHTGRVRPGLYRQGPFTLERASPRRWVVTRDGKLLSEHRTVADASQWCRRNRDPE
jgi:hypothetical protein